MRHYDWASLGPKTRYWNPHHMVEVNLMPPTSHDPQTCWNQKLMMLTHHEPINSVSTSWARPAPWTIPIKLITASRGETVLRTLAHCNLTPLPGKAIKLFFSTSPPKRKEMNLVCPHCKEWTQFLPGNWDTHLGYIGSFLCPSTHRYQESHNGQRAVLAPNIPWEKDYSLGHWYLQAHQTQKSQGKKITIF